MTENASVKPTLSLEAPASWNTKYVSPEGFTCQITLRADSGKELLEKAQAALSHLIAAGCTPSDTFTFRPRNNGGQKAQTDNVPSNGNGGTHAENNVITPAEGNGNGNAHLCPIHGVEMKKWEKDNKVWYSHKVDGGWCTGKTK